MSLNKPLIGIVEDGVYQFQTYQRMIFNTSPIEFACYEWLQQAYPDIFKEFIAVMEVSKSV